MFITSPMSKYISGLKNLKTVVRKPKEELTLEDRVKLSMKKLKVENERLRSENKILRNLK